MAEEATMKFLSRAASKQSRSQLARRVGMRLLPVVLGIMSISDPLLAQTAADSVDQHSLQVLLQRIDQLESRVRQLEAARLASNPSSPPPSPAQGSASPVTEPEMQNEPSEPERMDVSKTLLRIRGFGDVTLAGSNDKGRSTTFALGQLNLFLTSDISDNFKFVSEIVFEAGPPDIFGTQTGPPNHFGADIERYLLQYSYNDYFNLSVGRYHTAIGYYNTAYHHSTWFQTTTGRPFLFDFEDEGGILPIHNVGVEASGRIPSGALGLHYVAEVGNGRASRTPLSDEPVQNVVDENDHKAFNLAVFARPDKWHGLQTGISVYRDRLMPVGSPRIGETILAAHVVYTRPDFEWLNEALMVRHAPDGLSRTSVTSGFYSQISKRFGSYRPYFRYQYVNAPDTEPLFPDVGLRHGPSVGVRFDASESVALKLQYDYTALRNKSAIQALALQVGFTF